MSTNESKQEPNPAPSPQCGEPAAAFGSDDAVCSPTSDPTTPETKEVLS
jgi:hypothetical protein